MTFADYLKKQKRRTGYSWSEIARQSGVSRGYLDILLKGDSSPTEEIMQKLTRVFGVNYVIDAGWYDPDAPQSRVSISATGIELVWEQERNP